MTLVIVLVLECALFYSIDNHWAVLLWVIRLHTCLRSQWEGTASYLGPLFPALPSIKPPFYVSTSVPLLGLPEDLANGNGAWLEALLPFLFHCNKKWFICKNKWKHVTNFVKISRMWAPSLPVSSLSLIWKSSNAPFNPWGEGSCVDSDFRWTFLAFLLPFPILSFCFPYLLPLTITEHCFPQ